MNENITVDIPNLPFSPEKNQAILQAYFPEHLCEIVKQDTTTTKFLLKKDYKWYSSLEDMTKALQWWGGNSFQADKINTSFFMVQNAIITMLDSWSIYAWSSWLCGLANPPKECVLIHLDDHDDLMSPHIGISDSEWYDLITKNILNFDDPGSVFSSVLSGSIGIGSILTMMCFYFEKIHILHCQQSAHYQYTLGSFKLIRDCKHDAILDPHAYRAMIDISEEQDKGYNGSIYMVTNNFIDLLSPCPKNLPILLHIDMDFFNNRYNGDTDWEKNRNRNDPSMLKQLKQISEFFRLLEHYKLVEFVQHTAIAISPGFYPCEFWRTSIRHLLNEAVNHGLDLKEVRKLLQE
jgi:hypothetical protein